jgi:hypothetical protein
MTESQLAPLKKAFSAGKKIVSCVRGARTQLTVSMTALKEGQS